MLVNDWVDDGLQVLARQQVRMEPGHLPGEVKDMRQTQGDPSTRSVPNKLKLASANP